MYAEEPVQRAVNAAYALFAAYKRPSRWQAADGKGGERLLANLSLTPLREAAPDLVGRYAGSALYTIGNANDYRHFLPRVLELAVRGWVEWIGLDPPVIAAHLNYADWRLWPQAEQAAIKDVFTSACHWRGRSHPDESEAEDWLCGMAALELDVTDALQRWLTPFCVEGALQTANLLEFSLERLSGAGRDYWTYGSLAARQAIADWLLSDSVRSALSRGLEEASGDDADLLQRALARFDGLAAP